jgi:uncharacterized protein (DUF2062 family)
MLGWIKNFFLKLILHEQSSRRLAISFCVGNYIAFSPFIGFHGFMAFMLSLLFDLNVAVTFATTYFVNNIWTAIPVYTADYIFGYWLVHTMFGWNFEAYTFEWMHAISFYVEQKLGMPRLWSFLIGGNILGIIVSIALYPVMQHLFSQLLLQKNENSSTK